MLLDYRTTAILLTAVISRIALSRLFPSLVSLLDHRIELSTSMSSFRQLKEGLYLYENNFSAYDGGVYHQAPLLLLLFRLLRTIGSIAGNVDLVYDIFYCMLDVSTAILFCKLSKSPKYKTMTQLDPWILSALYLLNPLNLLTSFTKSTSNISTFFLILSFNCICYGYSIASAAVLAITGHINLYAFYLVPPFFTLWKESNKATYSVVSLLSTTLLLSFVSYTTTGSFDYIHATYYVINLINHFSLLNNSRLSFKDLVPNIGIWWYFFMEMFDFFRPFFTHIFQLYSLIYVLPITFRLKNDPMFAATTIYGIQTFSKPYPEVGDLGVYICLLALYKDILPNVRYALFSALVIMHALVLAPSFYHLWIYLGSGNANFFYAITLVYALGIVIIITDTLRARLRIEFDGGKDPRKEVLQI
ncbi:GPI transamidase subunit PIG-U [Dipodascopsis uninucleata]